MGRTVWPPYCKSIALTITAPFHVDETSAWMLANRLQLNPAKSEILWCASARRQHQIPTGPVRIGNTTVLPVSQVRDLGVYLDAEVTMKAHVTAIVRACFSVLRQIRSVRRSLSRHALLTSIIALVVSKIDCCNSVLAGAPEHLLDRLQSVLNAAARLIVAARNREHITPLLHELHWLRVPERIKFRLCVLAYRMSSRHSAIIPRRVSSVKHRRRSSPSPSVCRVTHAVSAVKSSVNTGRPFVSRSSFTRMEQSASCCQRHAVNAVFPSVFKDISVSIVIRLLTVSLVLSQRFSHR